MLGEDTSSTPPSQNIPPLNSVLKLFRNRKTEVTLGIVIGGLSRTLSLIPSWSGMKAALGAVSGVMVEVTQSVPSPGSGFVATQPAGSAGAVTPSKFSLQITVPTQGVGVGVGVVGVGVGVGVGQTPSVIVMVSTRHPGAATAASDPKRRRNVIVCPARFGPRLMTVSM